LYVNAKPKQSVELGLHRSDYMLHNAKGMERRRREKKTRQEEKKRRHRCERRDRDRDSDDRERVRVTFFLFFFQTVRSFYSKLKSIPYPPPFLLSEISQAISIGTKKKKEE
jgi:hypothetical protein